MKLILTIALMLGASIAFGQKDTVFTKRWLPIVGKVEKKEKRYIYVQRENTKIGVLFPVKTKAITYVQYADGTIEYYNPIEEKAELEEKPEELEETVQNPKRVKKPQEKEQVVEESTPKQEVERQPEPVKEEKVKASAAPGTATKGYFDSWKMTEPFKLKLSDVKVNLLAPMIGIGIHLPIIENRLYIGAEYNTSLRLNVYERDDLRSESRNPYYDFPYYVHYFTTIYDFRNVTDGNYHSTNYMFNLNLKLNLLPLDKKIRMVAGAGIGVASIEYTYMSVNFGPLNYIENSDTYEAEGEGFASNYTAMATNYNLSLGLEYPINSKWSIGAGVQMNLNKYRAVTSEINYVAFGGANRTLGGVKNVYLERNFMVPISMIFHLK